MGARALKQVNGWWVPDHMNNPAAHLRRSGVIEQACAYLAEFDRGVVLQAGGHLGIWPRKLAGIFGQVFTWEPMHENYECLLANTKDLKNVNVERGVLGHKEGELDMEYSPRNTGKHCVRQKGRPRRAGGSMAKVTVLDTFCKDIPVDAIFLDVEGYEQYALKGAKEILKRDHPLLVVEQNGLVKRYGFEDSDIQAYLAQFNYAPAAKFEEDVIYI